MNDKIVKWLKGLGKVYVAGMRRTHELWQGHNSGLFDTSAEKIESIGHLPPVFLEFFNLREKSPSFRWGSL